MALLLAPYNDAMRLGMGFNSFTQQLCVNDAVQRPGGIKATEEDLVRSSPVDDHDQPAPGVPKHTPCGEMTSYGFPKTEGGTFVRRHKDGGQADVSQVVTWKSTFVNNISEITEGMDIKGALAIKIDAVGGGAKAQASYLNTESFKKSDINYHLQVNVVNQRLVGENLTEFVPIKNVQPTQFQDVYGDCFISGFLKGGIFNAVISIELEDKDEARNFGGEMGIQAKFAAGAVEVGGEGKGGKQSSSKKNNDKITVSVCWSGGGDIITDNVEKDGWNIDTLKAVAIAFADKVAACPQKTSAILTKYNSLRSYYEKSLHGSPLDYENAGVYSSALLDAYMDYKAAWKELQAMSWQTNKHLAILQKAEEQPELKLIAGDAKTSYDNQMEAYNKSVAASKDTGSDTALVRRSAATNRSVGHKLEKPLEPNKLEPYSPSVFGLDRAQRDCRFEMIKIVREVDAVADNPQVAVDPTRNNQFLSPIIFRQLIPSAEKVDPVAMKKEIAELKDKLKSEESIVESLKSDNATLSTKLQATEAELKTVTENRDSLQTSLGSVTSKVETLTAEVNDAEKLATSIAKETEAQVSGLESDKSDLISKLKDATSSLKSRDGTIAVLESQIDAFKKGNESHAELSELLSAKTDELDELQRKFDAEVETRKGTEEREAKGAKELADANSEVLRLEGRNQELGNTVSTLNKSLNQQQSDLSDKQQTVDALKLEVDGLKREAIPSWDARNTLDQGFNGRDVAIVNMASMDDGHSGTCLDMGASERTRAHGWTFNVRYNYQKLTLKKAESSRASSWYIMNENRYLYCFNDGKTLMSDLSHDQPWGCCLWWIKKLDNTRGYMQVLALPPGPNQEPIIAVGYFVF